MRITITAAMLAVSVSAVAQDGYWENPQGEIWKNSYGECWRSGLWSKDKIIVGCDGMTAAKPAPAPAPVAAAPAAKPAPAPAPAPVAPPKDTDGDGVTDDKDQCPDTKKGAKVDAKGCYIVLKENVTVSINVKFPTGSSRVDAAGEAEIKQLADFMTEHPQTSVEVGGHTDNTGAVATNKRLSQARADAVRKTLIDKFGIDAGRVTAVGYGPDKPIADNGTADGRNANRRVEGVVSQTVEKVQQ